MTDELPDAIGEELRQLRRNAGLRQYEIAAATGISLSTISMIENGKRKPLFATVEKIRRACEEAATTMTSDD